MSSIILVGKSCSGKTYLKTKLIAKGWEPSVSFTTRPMREGEVEGVDYNFVTKELFEKAISLWLFLEHNEWKGWYYGTPDPGPKPKVFILTPAGIKQLPKEFRAKCTILYLATPEALRIERLIKRGDQNDPWTERIKRDDRDFEGFIDFDMMITPENLYL